MKKIISLFLSLLIAVNIFPATAFAEETGEQSLEDIIRPQIEAFAKSIDQPDADGKAADALATHGMFGRGKDLKVGEDHALTATLVNSELGKEYLTALCAELIRTTDELNTNKSYSLGDVKYSTDGTRQYAFMIYSYNEKWIVDDINCKNPSGNIKHSGDVIVKANAVYDDSLEWIVGHIDSDIDIERTNINNAKEIYNITVVFRDKFDFHTSTGSGFGDFISGIGALLFKEFTWYSTFDFEIEIPNDCEHSFGDWKTEKKPSCTEKGSEERKCANCGCVETKSIAATGHSFGEWQETKAPTYREEGEERRHCANCGAAETRTIAALEYLPGDVNGDENVDIFDANLVRRYSAKLAEFDEKQLASADVNGDGSVNVLDANIIRKYSAKIIDSFPAA